MGTCGRDLRGAGRLAAVGLLLFLCSHQAMAAVWYVNAASTAAAPDGKGWATAYPTIQQAVDVCAAGDGVWVAKGVYTGTGTEVVRLKTLITLYGGFAGWEQSRTQRNWITHETVIDGEQARRCVTGFDFSNAVDGFVVRNGNAEVGGGLITATAINCIFSGNSAEQGGALHQGKAVNCLFRNNTADSSGGAMYRGWTMNCTFTGNMAGSSGGGIYYGVATNCVLLNNGPDEVSNSSVSYCCLPQFQSGEGNVAAVPRFNCAWTGDLRLRAGSPGIDAGTSTDAPTTDLLGRPRPQGARVDMGAYEFNPVDSGSHVDVPPIRRVNAASTARNPDGLSWETAFSTLQAAADQTGFGGEIWVAAGTYTGTGIDVVRLQPGTTLLGGFAGNESARDQRDTVTNPTVIDGEVERRCVTAATKSVVDGFTLQNGSAPVGAGMWSGTAAHCVFLNNTAETNGGGMFVGTATNCVFLGNTSSASGSGMYGGTATNCTFTDNFAWFGSGIATVEAKNCILWGNGISEMSNSTVSYSCVSQAVPGEGNIVGTPLFVNYRGGDLRLRIGSPGIDAGTSSGVPAKDLLGRARPQGAGVDMGAYEHIAADDDEPIDTPPPLRVNVASTALNPDGLTWETAFPTLQAAADSAGCGGEIWVAAGVYTGTEYMVVSLRPQTLLFGGFSGTETSRDQRNPQTNQTIIDGEGVRLCVFAGAISLLDGFILQNGWGDYGGGMIGGRALNCSFKGNHAEMYGGAMHFGAATNCVFLGNSAEMYGGAMNGGTAVNCTFAGNSGGWYGGGMADGAATNCVFWGNVTNHVSGTTVTYSCLPWPQSGAGNIVGVPLFARAWAGDFRLCEGSPGIDAGTATGAPATDLLGRVRPQGSGVDMGAYEHTAADDGEPVVAPQTCRVNAASTALHPDGLTWATAFPTLQAAADHTGEGSEIWVATGTYTGTNNEVVRLRPKTSLLGGFSGNETAREQRNPRANPTVIDGQGERRCVTACGSSTMDGFTFQRGNARFGGGVWDGAVTNCAFADNTALWDGGGLYYGTATNCTFTGNFANTSGGGAYSSTVINCTFAGNVAGWRGGGISSGTALNCILCENTPDEVYFTPVTYSCLPQEQPGAGNIVGVPIFVQPRTGDVRLRAGSPGIDAGTATNAPATDLLGRVRPQGAGVDMGAYEHTPLDDSEPVLSEPVLRVSAASTASHPDGLTWETAFSTLQEAADRTAYGGEIWVTAGTYTGTGVAVVRLQPRTSLFGGFSGTETSREQRNAEAHLTVIDGEGNRGGVQGNATSLVDGFTIQNGRASRGGGANCCRAANCTFQRNSAILDGGGMYMGAATNCLFRGNSASSGGGMYMGAATNCLFRGNSASSGGGMFGGTAENCVFAVNSAGNGGGGMYSTEAMNCTILENMAVRNGGGMCSGKGTNCILWGNGPDESFSTSMSYSCLSSPLAEGTGNIVGKPLFINPWSGHYRLRAGSPGINSGTAAGAPVTDLLGRTRPQEGRVDMGAYEHTPADDTEPVTDPPTLRVNAASTATNPDGLRWETAFRTLQEAADRTEHGGEIWVAKGTYTGQRTAVVWLLPQTVLLGGFAGTETERDQRDIAQNPTIIDGELARRCVTASATSTLDGFIIQNGYATYYGGGVIYATARNCAFIRNLASYGGGMCYGTAVQCRFVGNYAFYGGGAAYSSVFNCEFRSNLYALGGQCTGVPGAEEYACELLGGGNNIYYGTATNCTFDGNGTDGTAMGFTWTTVPEVSGLARNAAHDLLAASLVYGGRERYEYNDVVPVDHVVSQSPGAGTSVWQWSKVDLTLSKGPSPRVPLLAGLTRAAAADALVAAGLALGHVSGAYSLTVPAGQIVSQAVAPGTMVLPGTAVDVAESLGGIAVPDVTGRPQAAAAASLTAAGLVLGSVTEAYSATVAAGSVVSQQPTAGTAVLPGTVVDVVVSRGAAPLYMPDLAGQSRTQAAAAVAAAGLTVGSVMEAHSATVAAGSVVSQSPAAGTEVPPGLAVSFVVSLGPAPAEGEGEGEGEPVSADTAKTELAAALEDADGDGDGQLSFTEASAAVSGLTQPVFDALDTDSDGQLSAAELGVAQDGCRGCSGAKSRGAAGGDWLAVLVALLGLAAMAGARRV